ncbi:MAG: hydroxymethylglutaryl-CoA lyase, partial [Burkholderiaceae bacterium]|nr:hydroxymethylglutaryl-CoA lyase [Burkholderiaceae bacterium]
MNNNVLIREVGLRDGLQMVKSFMPTGTKMEWIRRALACGLKEIEVCSFVPAKLIPQFSDCAEVVAQALALDRLTVSALVPNLKGAERGMALGVHKLNYVLSVSESHNLANVRRSTAESLEDFQHIVKLARTRDGLQRTLVAGGLSTAFGCTLEGQVSEVRVVELAAALVKAGADELIIADTVGYADPAAVRRVFTAVLAAVGNIPVAAHFHDTRGLGLANVLAALE